MEQLPDTRTEYRTAINAFRGFAALYVVLYHLRYYSNFDWFGTVPALQYGYLGVDFFFILSGLIVSHVYLRKSEGASFAFWRKFIWYRIARLLPVHSLIMMLMLVAATAVPLLSGQVSGLTTEDYWDWVLLTTLVRQWTLPANYAWNSPAWSVSAEMFAYLFVFPIVARLSSGSMNRMAGMVLVVLGGVILGFMVWQAGTVNLISHAAPLMRVTGGFLIGSGLYLILSSSDSQRDWERCLLLSFAALFAIMLFGPSLVSVGLSIDLLLLISLAAVISFIYLATGPVTTWFSRPGLFWFGEISFALYLCHIPTMRVCAWMARELGWNQGLLFGIFCVAASFAVAHLLYKTVEIPTRGTMRGWYDRLWPGAKVAVV